MAEAKIFEFPGSARSHPGKRVLTAEQREKRRELSRRPRRSKDGTPEERAARVTPGLIMEVPGKEEWDVIYRDLKFNVPRLSPEQLQLMHEVLQQKVEDRPCEATALPVAVQPSEQDCEPRQNDELDHGDDGFDLYRAYLLEQKALVDRYLKLIQERRR
jgi:hypothetical protein